MHQLGFEAEVIESAANQTPVIHRTSVRQTAFCGIISEAPSMQKIFNLLERVSKTPSTVLVLGESGTGKELIAKAIHKLSNRSGRLVPVNCGAIPEDILESELFGHERGSFTGAVAQKIGRFQLADNGTIFLDEIGEMSPKLQVKLLRVLQERKIDPVGSTRSIDIDVRVVAATNKDLREEVKAGRFREDLFYRLQVVPVTLPPLRARGGDDIRLLAKHFLDRSAAMVGRPEMLWSEEVLMALSDYAFPGNIRELENLVEQLAIMAEDSTIRLRDLPLHLFEKSKPESHGNLVNSIAPESFPSDGIDFNALVGQLETQLLTLALSKTNGNKKAAAKLLGLNRTTLIEKLKKKQLLTLCGGEEAELLNVA